MRFRVEISAFRVEITKWFRVEIMVLTRNHITRDHGFDSRSHHSRPWFRLETKLEWWFRLETMLLETMISTRDQDFGSFKSDLCSWWSSTNLHRSFIWSAVVDPNYLKKKLFDDIVSRSWRENFGEKHTVKCDFDSKSDINIKPPMGRAFQIWAWSIGFESKSQRAQHTVIQF